MNYARWYQLRGPVIARAPENDEGAEETAPAAEGAAQEEQAEEGADDEGGEDEGGEDSQAAAGEADEAAGDEGEDEVAPRTAKVPWQVKRLAKATAAAKEAQERAAALEAENEALKALAGRPDAEEVEPDPAPARKTGERTYTEAEFQQEAARRSGIASLNVKVDAIYDQAVKLDPKFTERLGPLREAVGEELAKRPDFFKALTKLENGAEVVNALSKDLDLFSEMLEGDPVDLALELAKMDRTVKKPGGRPPPSQAGTRHRPPATVDGTSTPEPDLEKMTEEEYSAVRAKQRQARAEARGGW